MTLEDLSRMNTEDVKARFTEAAEAEAVMGNMVYQSTALFERLEGAGLIRGNGHHMSQQVAKFATDLLKERWEGG